MSAGTDHDLKVLTERVEMHGDTLADLDCLTVKQSRAIDDLTRRLAELERRAAGPTKHEQSAVDDEDNQSTAVGFTALEIADLPVGSVVEDKEGRLWDRGDDGKWHRRVTDEAPPITAHMSSSLTMLRGPIFPSDDFIAVPHPRVPPMRFDRAKFPKPCDMAAGSTVTDRYGWQWTKQADPPGTWKAGANVVTDGILEKVFGPFSAATEPARRIDTDESLRNLNVGARVRSQNGVVWEKQDDGRWTNDVLLQGKTSGMLWVGHGPVFTLVRE